MWPFENLDMHQTDFVYSKEQLRDIVKSNNIVFDFYVSIYISFKRISLHIIKFSVLYLQFQVKKMNHLQLK